MGCYQSISVTLAPFYFISFVLAAQFVMLNLVVGFLMQELEDGPPETADEKDEDATPKHTSQVAPELSKDDKDEGPKDDTDGDDTPRKVMEEDLLTFKGQLEIVREGKRRLRSRRQSERRSEKRGIFDGVFGSATASAIDPPSDQGCIQTAH